MIRRIDQIVRSHFIFDVASWLDRSKVHRGRGEKGREGGGEGEEEEGGGVIHLAPQLVLHLSSIVIRSLTALLRMSVMLGGGHAVERVDRSPAITTTSRHAANTAARPPSTSSC